jgi:hypothetical protein
MAGKGDKPRPIEVDRKTFEDNWNRIFGNKDAMYESDNPLEGGVQAQMWEHHCSMNGRHMVEKGHPCNWCGEYEDGTLD